MEPAPLYEDVANGPAGGRAFWLTASDGVRLRLGHWPTSQSVRGTVLLFPGRTEYIEKYGPAAAAFTAEGFDMIAIDWRGQGLADRTGTDKMLGHVGDFAEYQLDVAAVMAIVKELGLPEPYHLVGHSMGGCIGLRSLHEALPVKSAVFSAPMWGIGLALWLKPVAWATSWMVHSMGRGLTQAPATTRESYVQVAPFENNQLTKDPDMWSFMLKQLETHPDLALGAPTVTWLYLALRETAALSAKPAPKVPTLTFLGADERIVAPDPIRALMSRWEGGELAVVDHAEHEIMMEVPASRDDFYRRAVGHFTKHS